MKEIVAPIKDKMEVLKEEVRQCNVSWNHHIGSINDIRLEVKQIADQFDAVNELRERINRFEGAIKAVDFKYSDEITKVKNNHNILKTKFSQYENEINIYKNQIGSYETQMELLKASIDRTNQNMSALIVNHKVEISQQIFRFRTDYHEMSSIVQDNNETMKKFKDAFIKYEVMVQTHNPTGKIQKIWKELEALERNKTGKSLYLCHNLNIEQNEFHKYKLQSSRDLTSFKIETENRFRNFIFENLDYL